MLRLATVDDVIVTREALSSAMSRTISNWSRTQRCKPSCFAQPVDEAELLGLVREARAAGTKIKLVGARHSWSDIAMTDHMMINLDRMQAIVAVDHARARVRVQAGIRLHRLADELAARGLALPIVGSVTEQSLGGLLSTGTHGSSLVHGNIASLVVGARLITGTGDVLELDEAHPLLPAVRVGLGALGILIEVTLAVVPAFRLQETTETMRFDDAVTHIEAIARSAEYVKLWWLPHTDEAIVFRYARTDTAARVSPLMRWIDAWLVNWLLFSLILWVSRWAPATIPVANRLVARTYLNRPPRIDRSDLMLSLAMPPRHREMEYAIALEHTGAAMQQTRALIERTGVRVNFIVEVRFVPADDAWLSPAYGRDSCQLGAYMAEAPGIASYFDAFEQAMLALDGRPHWGKEFSVSGADIRSRYPQAERFAEQLRALDPDGLFRNAFVERMFEH